MAKTTAATMETATGLKTEVKTEVKPEVKQEPNTSVPLPNPETFMNQNGMVSMSREELLAKLRGNGEKLRGDVAKLSAEEATTTLPKL